MTAAPVPVAVCPYCGTSHWRCVWCLPSNCKRPLKPSEWEQQRLRDDTYATLCVRCANKRLAKSWNALIPMRRRAT